MRVEFVSHCLVRMVVGVQWVFAVRKGVRLGKLWSSQDSTLGWHF
jgi:hypothetical protein